MKSFEDRLGRLEELSETIREGGIPLEEAVKHFEEGIKLAKGLEKDLEKIERRVEVMINQPEDTGDKPNLELFPELGEEEPG